MSQELSNTTAALVCVTPGHADRKSEYRVCERTPTGGVCFIETAAGSSSARGAPASGSCAFHGLGIRVEPSSALRQHNGDK
jgi:hypothetical protein